MGHKQSSKLFAIVFTNCTHVYILTAVKCLKYNLLLTKRNGEN